ncbi:hypothetical protein BU15DRAFT_83524 [Melanogaster broomeanus]|nr:hypothetical protein BU15DRAFT_83524 [Melanogaster broomeanus]
MVVAIAPWSIVLTPGKEEVIVPQGDLQIKNAALSDVLSDQSGRTTVKLTYLDLAPMESDDEDEEDENEPPKGSAVTTVLCSLTPGKIEQYSCEITLEQDNEYILELVGKNPVYLYGNYIDQAPVDQPPMDSDMGSESEEEEDAYNLGEVSSDVEIEADAHEIDLEDDVDRFEEVEDEEETKEAPPKNLKRPREDVVDIEEAGEKLSKSQRKKLAKKLKGEDGKAVPAPAEEKPAEDKEETKAEDKKDKKKKEKKEKAEQQEGEKKGKSPEKSGDTRTLEGGVKIRDAKVGTGKMAKKGDKVDMRYIGKLTDGKIFDKNTKGKPFTFTLGRGDVIKGWDVGIAGMQIGGEREVTVPPSMGYGNKKMADIPAKSTLIFEVKLLEIK